MNGARDPTRISHLAPVLALWRPPAPHGAPAAPRAATGTLRGLRGARARARAPAPFGLGCTLYPE